ncbi:carboxylesterase family protein [Paenibacillus sinopodophylli]|uniref:carboxylesterase family protein n=1 Tax=Paenibacillus sinopodophylli TaxID=1837342 RepID=UPI003CCC4EEA
MKQQEIGRKPSYVYYFTRPLPGNDEGAYHGCEPWYVFHTLSRNWRPMTADDKALSNRMVGYWTNFMKTGNANGAGLPEWKLCTLAEPFVLTLDVE